MAGVNPDTTRSRPGPLLVTEARTDTPPALVHTEWVAAFPWLVQGCTTRGPGRPPFDLGLFSGASDEAHVRSCWTTLCAGTGMHGAVHARQVHEAKVCVHEEGVEGLSVLGEFDGHVTNVSGILLAVTTADCVPVFVVDPVRHVVAALHAGWRGAAAGVLEEGLDVMAGRFGSVVEDVHIHLGPSICGSCYEVGPEVFEALDQPVPHGPTPIDLRAILARRAVAAGVSAHSTTVSTHCTRCTDSGLYSHRSGDRERQVGYIGLRQ
jgi:purine-nucleoside/S-methyl-5'-thioadenosine phosphorylase / adenosine deaminase